MRLKVVVEQHSMGAFILLHKNSQQGSGGGGSGSGRTCGSRSGVVAVMAVTMVAKEAVAAMVVVCLHDNTNHV